MNGRNAKKRMIRKIKNNIWRKQKKIAMQLAEEKMKKQLCKELASLSFWGRLKLLFGKFR